MINNKLFIPEILAPCGSYETLVAAINAGADACYIGGSKYSARAYAENLSEDLVQKAIDYVHNRGKKIYLTINTLFKDNEIDELVDYLIPYYEEGLDAVIVQDLGAFSVVKKNFPDLNIHCSTQMNITSLHAAVNMYNRGASRIVTAREMSLNEIKKIKEICNVEIESFVHGAMCYSYSGQCLMSSMAGGRSGNRGRCAQPCRKCYDGKYILSMKDMCTLSDVPDIIEAGIDSLKIEGRMKNKQYVASAVYAYKKAVDDYFNGCFDMKDIEKQKFILKNIYNRGGFCNGYYFTHNGPDMISKNRPNNQGVSIGKLIGVSNGKVKIKLKEDLFCKDVLEMELADGSKIEITSGIDASCNDVVFLNAPKTKYIKNNQEIYRTRCVKILEKTNEIPEKQERIKIKCTFTAKIGQPMTIALEQKLNNDVFYAKAEGNIVEKSKTQQLDINKIKEKISQVNDTAYIFDELIVDADCDSFVPMSILKQLRRKAIEILENNKLATYKRIYKQANETINSNIVDSLSENKKKSVNRTNTETIKYTENTENNNFTDNNNKTIDKIDLNISVPDKNVLSTLLDYDCIEYNAFYMSEKLCRYISNSDLYNSIKQRNIKIILELPNVVRNTFDIENFISDLKIDGFYVRNIDGLFALHNLHTINNYNIIIAASLYAYNKYAKEYISACFDDIKFEIPKELNLRELKVLNNNFNAVTNELIIYEHQQVMLSAQCLKKTNNTCDKIESVVKIEDDRHNTYYSKTLCEECVNVVYNGVPFSIMDRIDNLFLEGLNVSSFKINFTIEDEKTIKDVLNKYMCLKNGKVINKKGTVYTTGHLNRGVE